MQPLPLVERGTNGNKRLVVIVDDDHELIEALGDALSDAGFVVDGYTEPSSALERLRHPPRPCVIIVDFLMPEMDGEQFVRAADALDVGVPVMLLSGRGRDPESERRLPVQMVLQKPVQLQKLLEGLGQLIENHRARSHA